MFNLHIIHALFWSMITNYPCIKICAESYLSLCPEHTIVRVLLYRTQHQGFITFLHFYSIHNAAYAGRNYS
jgi:hypothetical protein